MPPAKPPDEFVRFFTAMEGHVVARYGTGTQIGAAREVPAAPTDPKARELLAARARHAGSGGGHPWGWDLEAVVAITRTEDALYGVTYSGHVKRGELKEVKRSAWEDQLKADAEAAKATAEAGAAAPV